MHQVDGTPTIITFMNITKIVKKLKIKTSVALCYGNLGIIQANTGNLFYAENLFLKQLHIYKQIGNREGLVRTYANLGDIYSCQGNLRKSSTYLKKGVSIGKRYKINAQLTYALFNLTSFYIKQKKYKLATLINCECLATMQEISEPNLKKECELRKQVLDIINFNNKTLSKKYCLNSWFKSFEKTLQEEINLDKKAYGYYYIWHVLNSLKKQHFKVTGVGAHIYKKKAILLYEKINKKYKNFKYFSRILELNNQN